MQEVHMVAQGKGGVGKTFIASLVVQYLQGKTTHLPTIQHLMQKSSIS